MLAVSTRALCGLLILAGLMRNVSSDVLGGHRAAGVVPQTDAAWSVPVAVFSDGVAPAQATRSIRRVYRVTAYCDRGLTAAGIPAGVGQCAAPADIPFGSRIYIPELDRTFVVTDRTGRRFRHNTVDLFLPSREQCLRFGRRYLECDITLAAPPPRYGSPQLVAALGAAGQ